MPVICIGIREIGKLNEAKELNKCEINYSWKKFHRIQGRTFFKPYQILKMRLVFQKSDVSKKF